MGTNQSNIPLFSENWYNGDKKKENSEDRRERRGGKRASFVVS